ncbi:MAG: hypothetical protein ACOCX2_15225, partial [Armatimonadota bacterium]
RSGTFGGENDDPANPIPPWEGDLGRPLAVYDATPLDHKVYKGKPPHMDDRLPHLPTCGGAILPAVNPYPSPTHSAQSTSYQSSCG